MLTLLEDIWHAVESVAYLMVQLLVMAINGWLLILAALLTLIESVLPSFPERPPLAGAGIEWLVWFIPVEAMLGAFAVMLTAWLLWELYTIIMKKIGTIT
ncbi:MAG: hypothetical protein WAN65_10180 [Candidatus Sulfotelmatobacter sp.]